MPHAGAAGLSAARLKQKLGSAWLAESCAPAPPRGSSARCVPAYAYCARRTSTTAAASLADMAPADSADEAPPGGGEGEGERGALAARPRRLVAGIQARGRGGGVACGAPVGWGHLQSDRTAPTTRRRSA
eukprot:SAG31_NODE_1356_length_8657_cov_4.678546_3_plen_130_part_00